MKKIVVILFALLMTSALSAKIMIQTEGLFLGNYFDYEYDCFNENPNNLDYSFGLFEGLQFSLGYELFSDRLENKFHYFFGIDLGIVEYFINTAAFVGFNYHLFDTEHFRYELMTTLNAGQIAGVKGPAYYFIQTNIDFVMNLKNRSLPYFGIGLSNINSTNINYFKDFGFDNLIIDCFAIHAILGLRL